MRIHVRAAVLTALAVLAGRPAAAQEPQRIDSTNLDREQCAAFDRALPRMRELATAGDWDGVCRTLAPFGELVTRARPTIDERNDVLYGLRETMGVPPRAPTEPGSKGLVADVLGADAAAAAHYREHIDHATRDVWGDKSVFVGYLVVFALRRHDLDAARTLLTEQLQLHRRTRPDADPGERAPMERLLRGIDDLRAAPTDPWRQLAFLRVYRANTFPPCGQNVWEVRRELQRLADAPAARSDVALRLALRCDEITTWWSVDGVRDEGALPTMRTCVDDGLVAAAGKRTDVADPWSPIHEIGSALWRTKDAARAVTAFEVLVTGTAATARAAGVESPASVPNLVHDALLQAAECKLALGQNAAALADLDRAEREFPFQTDCGTCRMGETARIATLRQRAAANDKPK